MSFINRWLPSGFEVPFLPETNEAPPGENCCWGGMLLSQFPASAETTLIQLWLIEIAKVRFSTWTFCDGKKPWKKIPQWPWGGSIDTLGEGSRPPSQDATTRMPYFGDPNLKLLNLHTGQLTIHPADSKCSKIMNRGGFWKRFKQEYGTPLKTNMTLENRNFQ